MKGIEPIIAAILIVAVTVALAIGVALWTMGITGSQMQMSPKLKTYGHIDPRGGGEFLVTIANKASVETTITDVYVNGKPAEIIGIEWGSKDSYVENVSGRLAVVMKPGGVAVVRARIKGMDFMAGTRYQVEVRTSTGYSFYTIMECPVTVHYVDLYSIFTTKPRLSIIDAGIINYETGKELFLISFTTGVRLPANYSSVTVYGITLRNDYGAPVASLQLNSPLTVTPDNPVFPEPGALYLRDRYLKAELVQGNLAGGRYSAAVDMSVNGERQEFIIRNVIVGVAPKPLFVFINLTGFPGGWWLNTPYMVSYIENIVGGESIVWITSYDQLYKLFYGSDSDLETLDPRLLDPRYRVFIINTHGEAFPIPSQAVLNPPPGKAYTSRTCCPAPYTHISYDASSYYWNYTDIEIADNGFMAHVDTSTGFVDKSWAASSLSSDWRRWSNGTYVDYRPRYLLDVRSRIAEKGWVLLMPSAYAFYYLVNNQYTNWGKGDSIHGLCYTYYGDLAALGIPPTEYVGHVQAGGGNVEPVAGWIGDLIWLFGDSNVNQTIYAPRQIWSDVGAVATRLAKLPGFPGYYYYSGYANRSAVAIFSAGDGYIILSGLDGNNRLHIRISIQAAIHYVLLASLSDT